MPTLRRTQSEKGNVMMTISQEMQNRTQPKKPSPVWRDCFNEEAEKRYKINTRAFMRKTNSKLMISTVFWHLVSVL